MEKDWSIEEKLERDLARIQRRRGKDNNRSRKSFSEPKRRTVLLDSDEDIDFLHDIGHHINDVVTATTANIGNVISSVLDKTSLENIQQIGMNLGRQIKEHIKPFLDELKIEMDYLKEDLKEITRNLDFDYDDEPEYKSRDQSNWR